MSWWQQLWQLHIIINILFTKLLRIFWWHIMQFCIHCAYSCETTLTWAFFKSQTKIITFKLVVFLIESLTPKSDSLALKDKNILIKSHNWNNSCVSYIIQYEDKIKIKPCSELAWLFNPWRPFAFLLAREETFGDITFQ